MGILFASLLKNDYSPILSYMKKKTLKISIVNVFYKDMSLNFALQTTIF